MAVVEVFCGRARELHVLFREGVALVRSAFVVAVNHLDVLKLVVWQRHQILRRTHVGHVAKVVCSVGVGRNIRSVVDAALCFCGGIEHLVQVTNNQVGWGVMGRVSGRKGQGNRTEQAHSLFCGWTLDVLEIWRFKR